MKKIVSEVVEVELASSRSTEAFSRYRFVPVLEQDFNSFLDIPYIPDLYSLPFTNVFTVTVKEEDRIDKVSFLFYRTTRLWWVICLYNRIQNPSDLPINTRLKIPSLDSLYAAGII